MADVISGIARQDFEANAASRSKIRKIGQEVPKALLLELFARKRAWLIYEAAWLASI